MGKLDYLIEHCTPGHKLKTRGEYEDYLFAISTLVNKLISLRASDPTRVTIHSRGGSCTMLTIRRGVFETNSSSSHSLCIVATGKNVQVDDYLPVQDGVLRLQPDEFGWGPSIHYDAWTKARYCLTWVMQCSNSKVQHFLMLRDALLRGCPGIKKFIFEGLRFRPDSPFEGIPAGESNIFIVALDENDSDYWSGCIDHQSDAVGAAAFESEAALYSFIFNTQSKLVIDNDNH